MTRSPHHRPQKTWQNTLYEVIFGTDTPAGKAFDVVLIISILLSVCLVMLDSISEVQEAYGEILFAGEWLFTLLFTLEYFLRLLSVRRPGRYAASFYGVVDLLAIIPTYVSLFLPGSHYLLVIRILRVLRIFRVLKFVQYIGEADFLMQSLRASRRKIVVFLFAVLSSTVIFGSIMYVIEDEKDGFTSIPRCVYWAIVTLTTVGYGDISPKTNLGQAVSAVIMILGYCIIAVPTGIVSAEMARMGNPGLASCQACGAEGHDQDAVYCKFCGGEL